MLEYWPFKNFYKTKLEISEEEKQQIKMMLYSFKDSTNVDQITTYKIINILDLPILKNTKRQIDDILEKMSLSLINSWAQLYRQNDSHDPHVHPNSIYSGVIYVDGHGEDGTNFFDNYSEQIYQEKFEINSLILFPSKIIHFAKSQKKDNGRIIISFNTEEKKC
jgi:hypothetical protein